MKDMYGRDLEVGQTVAAAFKLGDSPILRAGKIVELIPLKNKIRVDWFLGRMIPGKPTIIEVNHRYGGGSKVVVLGVDLPKIVL